MNSVPASASFPIPAQVDLDFAVTGVQPGVHGISPRVHFELEVINRSPDVRLRGISLQSQIQIECPQRTYSGAEKAKLEELFGTPDRWGQTLRNRLWCHVPVAIPPFEERTRVTLPVPCTFDLNVASAKYFHALEEGEVGILFLFSGSIFYLNQEGSLQVEQISWNKECSYRMPLDAWKRTIDAHYPNSAWLYLDREVFDRLYTFKRNSGAATWEHAIDRLLDDRKEAAR